MLKTEELAWNVKKWGIEVCGLQEHRLVHKEERKREINTIKTELGQALYTASAWRNSSNAATGGVGLVLGTTAQKLLLAVERALESVAQHDFLAVLGDFNARLGPEDVAFTASPETNDNGSRLLEVMEDTGF